MKNNIMDLWMYRLPSSYPISPAQVPASGIPPYRRVGSFH